jgi:serine/threonine protein kinase
VGTSAARGLKIFRSFISGVRRRAPKSLIVTNGHWGAKPMYSNVAKSWLRTIQNPRRAEVHSLALCNFATAREVAKLFFGHHEFWMIFRSASDKLNKWPILQHEHQMMIIKILLGILLGKRRRLNGHTVCERCLTSYLNATIFCGLILITVKLADFGTTKHGLSGKMQTYAGTSVYMAPEFWEQELAYTNAIDMWSFGVIAMKLLTDWETNSDAWDPRFPPVRLNIQSGFARISSRAWNSHQRCIEAFCGTASRKS